MAAADRDRSGPDLYQLLGVAHSASREEIAQAWRRRVRAEHPDSRPAQAGDEAAGRFRALTEAWRVLSDPGRRAAYDRALERGQAATGMPAAVSVPVRRVRPGGVTGLSSVPGPPLVAGPVRVEGPRPAPAPGGWDEEDARLAVESPARPGPGWADPGRGLFSISVAAELAGLHPQTLRIYEREGLLDPARSAGGTRRYSRRDIDRLAEICALTADGLNLAGIRRVLALQAETRQLQAELARLRDLAGSSEPAAPQGRDRRGRRPAQGG